MCLKKTKATTRSWKWDFSLKKTWTQLNFDDNMFKKLGVSNKRLEEQLLLKRKNSWRNMLQLIRLIGNRLETWLGIKRAPQRSRVSQSAKKTVCKRKTVKTLNIPPLVIHNIIKIFRESGDISVYMLWALRQLCIKKQVWLYPGDHCMNSGEGG